jgi:hypothetical protein
MESMGLERLDRPTSLALRTLQDLIMLKKTTADMSFVPALVYAGEFGPALAVGLLGSALKKLPLFLNCRNQENFRGIFCNFAK